MRAVTVLSFFTLLKGVFAVSEVVDLSYASYRGTALSNGVTQWLGMRFAAPPLGHLRFAAPEDPLRETSGIKPAHAHGPYCLGTASGPPTNVSSEDCLFMDIYAPSHAKPGSKLPVYLFIQGGGFNADSNANFNGSGLVIASHLDIVVVTFNYRVGPYGFLAGEEILKHGSVNNGLKDQRQAMHWVQKYISKFGGDPGHVTIGGDSAGAQSVDLHVTAYGGRNDNLFQATTAESQSFSSLRTVAESQFMYDGLVLRAGCASRVDTLACLRGLSAEALQAININTPFPGAQDPPLYMYGPTLDYDFITDYTYRAYAQGKFLHLPALAGDDTNEGTIFVPMDTANLSMSDIFIQSQFPTISLHQLRNFNELYPVKGTPSFPNAGRYWRQASNGYGEMRYTCPGVFISNVYANEKVAANWNYRWNVMDPTSEEEGKLGYGVSHTIEINAIWGPNNTNGGAPQSYYAGGVNGAIVPVMQAYWTSFIRSYDPNTHRLPGTPKWEAWTTEHTYRRLRFQTNDTAMEDVPSDQKNRCSYLNSIGLSLHQ